MSAFVNNTRLGATLAVVDTKGWPAVVGTAVLVDGVTMLDALGFRTIGTAYTQKSLMNGRLSMLCTS